MSETAALPDQLTMLTISPAQTSEDWCDAARLLTQYFAWVERTVGVESVDQIQPFARREGDDLASVYAGRGSTLLLARLGDLAVGIVGIRPTRDPETGELTRFYVRPVARGTGAGRHLLRRAISVAGALDYRQLVLETMPAHMGAAVHLYEALGFRPDDGPTELTVDGAARYRLALLTRTDRRPRARLLRVAVAMAGALVLAAASVGCASDRSMSTDQPPITAGTSDESSPVDSPAPTASVWPTSTIIPPTIGHGLPE